ncbi:MULTISPECIES: amino acid ABC transporter permease [unclassified Aeromicrobium]|uniref:amino acid ABC transporter permease n=1 Tax=unclassified Aeromicrobium TaxID=2633570 RepID=UPI002097B037|nr:MULTISPECIES: amino acid ABC transporter permease [unclassified Aeromicrobium]MCO7239350.1 amino acid ABC transporter permease [Aeromicrobium sp. CnD17-E]MDR6117764.1 polar amino acid transport system permease protein [Aeromicrobium sp. SORGH_AS_0981]
MAVGRRRRARAEPVLSTHQPSERQQARERYRRSRALRRGSVAAVSTVVVLGLLLLGVVSSPGWDRVQRTFFDWQDAKDSVGPITEAFWLNVRLFVVCEVFILVVALVVAVVRVVPSPAMAPLRLLATIYTDVFRGTPTLLVVLLVGFGVPALDLAGAPTSLFWLGVIALTLSYGAYVAEVIRAGILSVHPTQWASGRALGLSYGRTLRHVVLPQALRRVTPPLLNDFVSLQKDTALLSVIGLVEALRQANIISNRDFVFTPLVVAAVLFIAATIVLARLADWLTVRSMRREAGGL